LIFRFTLLHTITPKPADCKRKITLFKGINLS
jgi:hypothetical protein